jgi:dCTP diphosphatase
MNGRPSDVALDSLLNLRDALRKFSAEREWEKFHSPKNLAIALSVEAAELLEHFQWISDADSADMAPATRTKVGEELADVLIYLVQLADKLDVDLTKAANEKLQQNAEKYPVEKARGSSKKYSEL